MSQPQNLRADELQHPTPLTTLEAVPEPAHSPDDLVGQVSVATPRLRAVGGPAGHQVPATVRGAESMTDDALALRLRAITRLGVVSTPATVPADGTPAVVPGGRGLVGGVGVPGARAWAFRLVQAVSEVVAGDRPISQLVRFTDDAVFTELNKQVRLLGLTTTATARGTRERSAVRSVRVCRPTPRVAEVAAHVRHGDRSRAIALRMEIRRNRWVCTALELG